MPAATLSPSTVAYLFAAEWAPAPDVQPAFGVPNGTVDGIQAGGELLHVAVLSLADQGLVELEQLRDVRPEGGLLLGGRSFTRLTARDGDGERPGIEGALLAAARDRQRQDLGARLGRLGARLVDRLSGEDELGLRGAVLALSLHTRHPWTTLADLCHDELRAAGAAKDAGGPMRRRVVIDPAAIDAERARHAELSAGRAERRRRLPNLDDAVHRDCLSAMRWVLSPTGPD